MRRSFVRSFMNSRLGRHALVACLLPAGVVAQTDTRRPVERPPAPVRASTRQAAAVPSVPLSFDSSLFNALKWREIGPARGGRTVAVAGSAQRPLEYWMGTTGGGVYKTTDGGMN